MADGERVELLHGTLDMIVLRALATMGPLHAYALASRLDQVAEHPLMLNQGTLYPALVRLEQRGWIKGTWRQTESRREAKFYTITPAGRPAGEDPAVRGRGSRARDRESSGAASGQLRGPRLVAGRGETCRTARPWQRRACQGTASGRAVFSLG